MLERLKRQNSITRREFLKLAEGVVVMGVVPIAITAVNVNESQKYLNEQISQHIMKDSLSNRLFYAMIGIPTFFASFAFGCMISGERVFGDPENTRSY